MQILERKLANAEKAINKDYVKDAKEFAEDVVDTVKEKAPKAAKETVKAAKKLKLKYKNNKL